MHQSGVYGSNGFQYRPGDQTVSNSSVLLDVSPYYPVEVRIRFGRTYCLHLQIRRVSQISCLLLGAYFLGLLFDYEDSCTAFLRNVSDLPNYTVSPQITVTAVRISSSDHRFLQVHRGTSGNNMRGRCYSPLNILSSATIRILSFYTIQHL